MMTSGTKMLIFVHVTLPLFSLLSLSQHFLQLKAADADTEKVKQKVSRKKLHFFVTLKDISGTDQNT